MKFLREFRLEEGTDGDLKAGDRVLAEEFKPKEKVDVIGISKGQGFAGVVKRHHFRGCDATHGSMFHRAPGSIGASSFPSRVFPGMRMGGQMGTTRVTVRNLEIIEVDAEDNVILVKGAVPGPNGGYVIMTESQEVAMPSVDVIDLNNKVVGTVELADAVFGAPVNENSVVRGRAPSSGRHAPRNGVDQDASRSGRFGQEIVEAEGHRTRPYGFDPQSSVAPWRHDPWAAAERLFLQAAAQNAARRVEERALRETPRWRIARGERILDQRAEIEADAPGARRIEGRAHGAGRR